MATIAEIKAELWEIAKAYPTLTGLLQREIGKSNLATHWATMLKPYDLDDIIDICEQYAQCRRQLPQPSDGLIYELVEYCRDAKWQRERRLEQYEKIHRPARMSMAELGAAGTNDQKITAASHMSVALGDMVKRGELSREENDCKLSEMLEYAFRAGSKPEWL